MALKKGEFEGLTPGTNIPMFYGVETPAYGGVSSDEYTKYVRDWYYRNGSMQNGMFVAAGATPEMYKANMAVGYNPQVATQAAQTYLEENPKPLYEANVPDFSSRDAAAGKARSGIEEAFRNYGITDLSPYSGDIESRMARTIAGIPSGTTDYDSYFNNLNLGQGLISELEGPYRNKAKTAFDKDIQSDYFNDTSDDAAINSLIGAERPTAEAFLKTMFDRGQILQPGYDAGLLDINRQEGLGRTRLNEIGANLLNTEEGVLGTERTKRRGAYDSLKLGGAYDVGADDAALDKMASDFLGTLGTGLKSGLGGTPLFATGGLGAIAGAAQGGQNTAFGTGGGTAAGGSQTNPTITPPDEDEQPTQQNVLF